MSDDGQATIDDEARDFPDFFLIVEDEHGRHLMATPLLESFLDEADPDGPWIECTDEWMEQFHKELLARLPPGRDQSTPNQ